MLELNTFTSFKICKQQIIQFKHFIDKEYIFYTGKPISTLTSDDFIKKHFKLLNGKIYKPSQLDEEIIFAFEKSSGFESIVNQIRIDMEGFEVYIIK